MPAALTVTEAVINQVARDSNVMATAKGFWDAGDPYLAEINTKLLLITSEALEAMEVLRERYEDSPPSIYSRMTVMQEEDFLEEIADVVIRALDLMASFTAVPGEIIIGKMQRNSSRPPGHGKRF